MRALIPAKVVTLWALAMLAFGPHESAAQSCSSNQAACENCCNNVFQSCVFGGGTPTGECSWNGSSCGQPRCLLS